MSAVPLHRSEALGSGPLTEMVVGSLLQIHLSLIPYDLFVDLLGI